ncbi:unnamed protein product [Xylocopa violacea]|uniref:Uncharacterized protein n=1 Tax=Xylocopa violacea TaxID=135666 RepID=A0ABP1NV21_XYLVO
MPRGPALFLRLGGTLDRFLDRRVPLDGPAVPGNESSFRRPPGGSSRACWLGSRRVSRLTRPRPAPEPSRFRARSSPPALFRHGKSNRTPGALFRPLFRTRNANVLSETFEYRERIGNTSRKIPRKFMVLVRSTRFVWGYKKKGEKSIRRQDRVQEISSPSGRG